jgi:phosphotransferase system HPr-like phosphotransfer protein
MEVIIMTSVKISLNSIDKVKNFVNVINTFDGDFDLTSDRYVIDAKSIMGIFSLDITNELRLDIHDDSEVDAVKKALADFIVG